MQTVLITGASGGIGKAFAELCAEKGHRIVLAARNERKLDALAHELAHRYAVDAITVPVDLTRDDGPELLHRKLREDDIAIDILVNNAGVGSFGPLHEQDIRSELDMIQLNARSLSHLMMLFLRDMVARGSGRILNVGSTTSFYACPMSANYSATKAFVLSLTEAVAAELRGTGVSVTALCPGPTGTEFFSRAKMDGQKVAKPSALMPPMQAARIGYAAMMKGKTSVVPGFGNWLLTQAPRLFTRRFVTRVTKSVIMQKL
ncbi:SDR family NAD(P)-dependent oxidoreductase [Cohnella sp. GCM10027633]|uniref:SDR family NAD(P)-dependent oxidoreductase n=1 Tax=unclassified Cohnella TaxID=2636738 RepID=UPI00362F2905